MIEQSEWWTRVSHKGNCFIWTFISSIEIDPELVNSFIFAAADGDVSEVVRMLDGGMPVDSFDGYGRTALQQAARYNRTDVIHELLQRGADVNKRDRYFGLTALHWSAMKNNTDDIRLLLRNGASTTIKEKWGRTPIDCAREENNQEAVLLLRH